MKSKRVFLKKNYSFLKNAVVSIFIIIILGLYIGCLAFSSKNSYDVYKKLRYEKKALTVNIDILQDQNAKLQKKFFELENLEPERTYK